MHSWLRRCEAIATIWVAVGAAGCWPVEEAGPAPSAPIRTPLPTEGQLGRARFGYAALGGARPMAVPFAAGGAGGVVLVEPTGTPRWAEVRSSAPEVASFEWSGVDPRASSILMRSGSEGLAELILLDETGTEIDRTVVIVRDTTRLGGERGWGPDPGPVVLQGSLQLLHLVTQVEERVTIGVGAIDFTLSGGLERREPTEVLSEPAITFGDSVAFQAHADGTLHAACPRVALDVPIRVVGTAALDQVIAVPLSFADQDDLRPLVEVHARAGGRPVYGATCTWRSDPVGLSVSGPLRDVDREATVRPSHGWLGTTAAYGYRFSGPSGEYQATCEMGAARGTVRVRIP